MASKWLTEAEAELRERFFPVPRANSDNSAERAGQTASIGPNDTIGTVPVEKDRPPIRREKGDSGFLGANGSFSAESRLKDWRDGAAQLDREKPIGDFPSTRWVRLVDDVARFLGGPLAGEAARLGWGTLDLFGADRVKPFARIDRAGLLLLLNGDSIAQLERGSAKITARTGAGLAFRRRPIDPAQVRPLWELG